MRVLGIDFTCSPSRRKPLTCAVCDLDGDVLFVRRILSGPTLEHFAHWLDSPGPWVAGCDFPFGLPAPVTRQLGLADDWAAQARHFGQLDRDTLRQLLAEFRAHRAPGDKEPPRLTDRLVGAQSAMKSVNPPVALMYQAGAPRLERSTLNVLCCRPTHDPRQVMETYPALVARGLVGRSPYKHDAPHPLERQRRQTRTRLIRGLLTHLPNWLGLTLRLSHYQQRQLATQASGDRLDAVLCAVHAAWAWRSPDASRPPMDIPQAEGWIPPLPRSNLMHSGR